MNEVRMWKVKINIRMGNEEGVFEELVELIEKEGLEVEDLVDVLVIMV